jgi:hypothetical protein
MFLYGEYHSTPIESTLIALPAKRVPGLKDVVESIGHENITTSASLYSALQLWNDKSTLLKLI